MDNLDKEIYYLLFFIIVILKCYKLVFICSDKINICNVMKF